MKKRMKRMMLCLTMITMLVGLCACSGDVRNVTDISQYVDKAEFKGYSGLALFPDSVDESVVDQYFYDFQDTMFDPTVQIYLKCTYTQEAFDAECQRMAGESITSDGVTHTVQYNQEDYLLPAYEAIHGSNFCYEYALVDEDNCSIQYLFLQFVTKEDMVFDTKLLPDDYLDSIDLPDDYDADDTSIGFDIYAFPFGGSGDAASGYRMVYQ